MREESVWSDRQSVSDAPLMQRGRRASACLPHAYGALLHVDRLGEGGLGEADEVALLPDELTPTEALALRP